MNTFLEFSGLLEPFKKVSIKPHSGKKKVGGWGLLILLGGLLFSCECPVEMTNDPPPPVIEDQSFKVGKT